MKVLYLVPQPKQPGRIGAYTFLDEEIHALAAAGIRTYVLSRQIPADTWCGPVRMKAAPLSSVSRLGVGAFVMKHLDQVPPQYAFAPGLLYHAARLEQQAAAMVEEEGIDLIHSHFAFPEGFGGILTRAATGRPLVASLRGTDVLVDDDLDYGRRRETAYSRSLLLLLGTAERAICFSEFMRKQVVSLGVDPGRARVVRKGVDLSLFRHVQDRQALKARLGLPPGPLILSVGGLIRRKGVHITLRALALVRNAHEFTFVVCGDGHEREGLRQLATELGLSGVIRFVGVVDRTNVADYFSACDVLAHAPLLEAAGNVLFEAMASGRPVVCTRSGGPEEYVEDGRTGYVVDPGDPRALAERISMLLADPVLADRLGAEGLRQSRSAFAFDRMTRDIIAVYEEALAVSRRRAS
jgi:glycosyltransferase involved in cell wall biosynthesis